MAPAGSWTEGEPAASPSRLNGFGVADWLLEPLLLVAADGLEFLQRNEAPPRLVPLVGKRLRKLGKPEREAILAALGQHKRFTEVVIDMFRSVHFACSAIYEQLSTEKIIDHLEQGLDDAAHAVSALLAWDRIEEAREVATRAEEDPEPDELEGLIGALARESWNSQEEIRRLRRDLTAERRVIKRLERRLERASQTLEEKAKEAAGAAGRARSLQEECAMMRAHERGLVARAAELEEAGEVARRERRDLRAELEDLQERYRRVRRELKEARSRLPMLETPEERPEGARARAMPTARPAPTLSELRDRFLEEGARGVLEAKQVLLLVDGWNVSLGHIAAERLEDKRRVLEQALQRYQSRTGNRVIVVYDGRKVSWFWVPRVGAHTITRVFTSEGETADDFIVSELEAGTPGVGPVVVTSDRELGRRCMASGAFVISSEDLARSVGL